MNEGCMSNDYKRGRVFYCGGCGKVCSSEGVLSVLLKPELYRCEQCMFVPITRKEINEKIDLCDTFTTHTNNCTKIYNRLE